MKKSLITSGTEVKHLDNVLQKIFVVVVALLFYVHGKHLRSCREGLLT